MDSPLKESSSSKKYQLAVAALFLITAGWAAGNWSPVLVQSFSELISGIMGVLALYYTGNVSNKFVVGRHEIEAAKVAGGSNGTDTK